MSKLISRRTITVLWIGLVFVLSLLLHDRGATVGALLKAGKLAALKRPSVTPGAERDVLLSASVKDDTETSLPIAAADIETSSLDALGEVTAGYYPMTSLAEPEQIENSRQLLTDTSSQPVSKWDPSEFEMLAPKDYETTDILAQLPIGAVLNPPEVLSVEELLGSVRAEDPAGYGMPGVGVGEPFKLDYSRPGDENKPGSSLGDGQIQIESTDYLDYDEEHNQVYGQGRITIRYAKYKLTADRIMVDTRLKEIQAYGNVVLVGPGSQIKCESMWVDALHYQGVAYQSQGHYGDFYILASDPHQHSGTTIHQVSKSETVLEDSSFTTCDFPVPHYRLRAREFTLWAGDRIFAKNVTLYIMEAPVLWLPYFTRKLKDSNPWGISAGLDSNLGFFVRVFYDFHHSCYTPSDVDDDLMIRSQDGDARLRLDLFSNRGYGKGGDYNYYFDNGKHIGHAKVYSLQDRDRNIAGKDESDRYLLDWFHRTRISDELDLMVDTFWASDPDLYYDTLDRVRSSSEYRVGRMPERKALMGLEWTTDDFFAGIQVSFKDRIGRDRVSNFSEFHDNDFDYDRAFNNEKTFTLLAPGVGPDGQFYPTAGTYLDPSSVNGTLDNGVSSDRYGRVSEKLPQLTVSSNRMRLWTLPLWYHVDLNVFNNLDKGLNIVGTYDDSFVHGFDLYQSLSHLMKFCDRYTLLTKFGLGVGVADREDDSFNINFPAGATFPFVVDGQLINGVPVGLTFVDEDTFLVGRRRMSLSQVDPAFAYGDIDSKFNARITENLSAFIRYRFREGVGDNIGQFYESIGSRKTMDDLYAFRTPEHWLEGGMSYSLPVPRLSANATVGQNLQGNDQITPGELRSYSNFSLAYSNLCNTLFMNAGLGLQERQMRDVTDPNQFTQGSLTYYLSGSYIPVHQRWWTRASAYFIQQAEDDPLGIQSDRDFDTRNETVLDYTVGKKIGTKYLVELRTRLRSRANENQDSYVSVQRDFHDVVAGVSLGIRSKDRLSDVSETAEDNFQVRFNLKFKPSSQKGVVPLTNSRTLFNGQRTSAFDRNG